MNGDVNGTMAEPMEVTLPSSPASKSDVTKVTPEGCDDNSKDCENSIHAESDKEIDSDSKNGTANNGLPEKSANENSNDVDNNEPPDCTPETTPEAKTQEHAEDNSTENQCNNDLPANLNILNLQETDKNDVAQVNITPETTPEAKIQEHTEDNSTENQCNNDLPANLNVLNLQESDKNDEGQDSLGEAEDDIEDESNAEDCSAVSGEQRAEDTVSINSKSDNEDRDETSQESQNKNKINDIIILGGEDRPSSNNSDIQEIESDNDECVMDSGDKTVANQAEEKKDEDEKMQLRRSSRSIKRKRYIDEVENGEESDIEEVLFGDTLRRKSKPIVINDTKALVAMAAKQMKANHGSNQKKEPTVVIIETNSFTSSGKNIISQKNSVSSTNSASAQSLYQSIVARGTTVTPVSSKSNNNNNNTSSQASQNAQPAILPSLTDDMFVVEAPSFIVPYVYEKPSVKPFREFVDKLGKELEEEKIKEDLKTKSKREKERQERKDRGEEVVSDDEGNVKTSQKLEEPEDEVSKKKKSKRDRRRRTEEDDDSWDGESASESDEALSDEDDKIVVKDKAEPIDQINVVADLTADKICLNKSNGLSSMDCSLGKFFINIGLNLVQEYVQSDLLKQQNRKLYKEKKAGHSTKPTESSIAQLMKNLEFSKENNAPYSFPQKKCEFCSFKTESELVMAQHLETPHMKNNVYKCNFCTFEIRSPHDILYHMEAEHNVRGKLERAPSYHQCANCPFEDNGKGKLARHLIACAKKFKPDSNLAPPVDWEPPAKIPKITRPRNNIINPYQNAFNRGPMGTSIRAPMTVTGLAAGINSGYRPRVRSPMGAPTRAPVHGVPILRGPSMMRHNTPGSLNMSNNFSIANNSKPKSVHQPSISITPLPRQPQPVHQPQPSNINSSKNTFVICEICDGYIKDLEQLRNHMQWIHKVKIHPKMIYNRPPLNCQKCQFRFFTDQGLERHLLGSHGLVTSSMQEAANKGKDAGRCPVCGRVYQWKLLNHVARDHNITLKPAHLSYKCTVCTATFGMYKQFENHVYSAHSVVAKRVMDKKTSTQPTKTNENLAKPLKINDEITIIPQSVKPLADTSAKDK